MVGSTVSFVGRSQKAQRVGWVGVRVDVTFRQTEKIGSGGSPFFCFFLNKNVLFRGPID